MYLGGKVGAAENRSSFRKMAKSEPTRTNPPDGFFFSFDSRGTNRPRVDDLDRTRGLPHWCDHRRFHDSDWRNAFTAGYGSGLRLTVVVLSEYWGRSLIPTQISKLVFFCTFTTPSSLFTHSLFFMSYVLNFDNLQRGPISTQWWGKCRRYSLEILEQF